MKMGTKKKLIRDKKEAIGDFCCPQWPVYQVVF